MRGRGLCIVVGVLLLAPVAALADDPAPACGSGTCGTPSCWEPKVRTRPDVIRSLRVTCLGAVGATVVTQPSFGTVSDVTTSADRLLFTLHEAAIGPRFDEAVFRVDGHEHPIDLHVAIESIPSAENHAPVCQGDNVTQRSDGSSSVDLFVHPWCYDPDGDDFVMKGGGPGVHPQSPKTVPPGDSEANWYYRTATHAGTETTPIWATDSLGARSPDATLTVTVGPDVDRLPVCHPNPYSLPAPAVYSIYSRPGATRRFGLICEDADTDPLDVGLEAPPDAGSMTSFSVGPNSDGFWGRERWVDATYVPADAGLETDEFTVRASGTKGSTAQRMAITPREPPANGGGACGYSPLVVAPGASGDVTITCTDEDGDQLTAEVIDGPLHGTVAPAAVAYDANGWDKVVVPYTPSPGYTGYDCVKVRVSDGHGVAFDMPVDVFVRQPSAGAPMPAPSPPSAPPTVPPPAPAPLPTTGSGSGDVPTAHTAARRSIAEQALGTGAVTRVTFKDSSIEVWAPDRLSRRALLLKQSIAGVVVVCPDDCDVRSEVRLLSGGPHPRHGRLQRSVLLGVPEEASVISLAADRADRRILRRPGPAFAAFAFSVRVGHGQRTTVHRRIRVGS